MSPNVVNRPLTEADFPAVSLLHAKVFGPGRFTRTAYRVRRGQRRSRRFAVWRCWATG